MQKNLENIKNIYFLGIGGIGMSALAQYFKHIGKNVAGYDRTQTPLTTMLEEKGMSIHYTDNVVAIPKQYLVKPDTLVVRTPAVSAEHTELIYFQNNGFQLLKRAQVLGMLFNRQKGIAVAGTHGKTSISSILTYLLHQNGFDNSAFLGGLVKNFESNFLLGNSNWVVAEADEYDRSFLQLNPYAAIISSIDADHLDIYADINDLKQAFHQFINQINDGGVLLHKKGLPIKAPGKILKYTYALNNPEADFYAQNIRLVNHQYQFDWITPKGAVSNVSLQVLGKVNIENSIAALSMAYLQGGNANMLAKTLAGFQGVKRRMDKQYDNGKVVYIDDYAHHPEELNAAIGSVRDMYPGKKITGVFQPHLYSRTRDFADGFAKSLSQLHEVYLLDIYPARELPIPGVSSNIIFDKITLEHKQKCSKKNLISILKGQYIEVLLTLGAGDIDQMVEPIKKMLKGE